MDADDRQTESPPPLQPERAWLQRRWEFDDPTVLQTRVLRKQILVWVTAVAVLLAMGGTLVHMTAEERARNGAYRAAVEADLSRLVAVQQSYYEANARYASLDDLGIDYVSSQGVRVRIDNANANGWSAGVWHMRTSYTCTVAITMLPNPDRELPETDCR